MHLFASPPRATHLLRHGCLVRGAARAVQENVLNEECLVLAALGNLHLTAALRCQMPMRPDSGGGTYHAQLHRGFFFLRRGRLGGHPRTSGAARSPLPTQDGCNSGEEAAQSQGGHRHQRAQHQRSRLRHLLHHSVAWRQNDRRMLSKTVVEARIRDYQAKKSMLLCRFARLDILLSIRQCQFFLQKKNFNIFCSKYSVILDSLQAVFYVDDINLNFKYPLPFINSIFL
jgi:hypothetical protein